MPDPYVTKHGVVVIDRLVLDIPGIDAEQARTIARELGIRLAGAGLAGVHDAVAVDLEGDGDLPARIAAALRERLL